jgi:hypothetical protein
MLASGHPPRRRGTLHRRPLTGITVSKPDRSSFGCPVAGSLSVKSEALVAGPGVALVSDEALVSPPEAPAEGRSSTPAGLEALGACLDQRHPIRCAQCWLRMRETQTESLPGNPRENRVL